MLAVSSIAVLPLAMSLIDTSTALSHLIPEIDAAQRGKASCLLGSIFGPNSHERKLQAMQVSESYTQIGSHMKVYGELGLDSLVTVLDAVGVRSQGESFLDIGSGDGYLVIAASILYPNLVTSRGVEIIPSLYKRSLAFHQKFLLQLRNTGANDQETSACPCQFLLDDVLQPSEELIEVLQKTTLAVCFATTWSRGSTHRRLPELSRALLAMQKGTRIVMIDGVLTDGWEDCGEFKLHCPDTAPYSIARLFTRI